MRVAIDISPLQTGHKVRGAGFYLEHLKRSLLKYVANNEYIFFIRGENLPKIVDIVHFPYFEPFFLALPIYKKYKTVVTVHDLTPIVFKDHFSRGIKGEIKWQMQKHALKRADAILTDSQSSKKDILKYVKTKDSKVSVVYLAAGEEFVRIQNSESKIQNLRKKYNLPDKFALYVGDVTWNKNLPNLVKAIKQTEIPLVMVGKALTSQNYDRNNMWNKDLVEVQQLTELNKNIVMLGFVSTEDLVILYNLATLFIMPSFYEGFGLPILEAMSCGCPVITTKEGSLAEVAKDAAYYVDPYNIESISDGIIKVFKNSNLRKDLSQKGLENVKSFSWQKTAKETAQIYEKVLKS